MIFFCKQPKAKDFSFSRRVENIWLIRKVFFMCGLSGSGWYLGFIRYDKEEKSEGQKP